ncbi:MAG: hypothetical protein H7834_07070 [Magnetococcus sp. YQC-9]
MLPALCDGDDSDKSTPTVKERKSMGHLLVRHVDDAVIERLILKAEGLGIPIEAYLRQLLTEAAGAGENDDRANGAAPSRADDAGAE